LSSRLLHACACTRRPPPLARARGAVLALAWRSHATCPLASWQLGRRPQPRQCAPGGGCCARGRREGGAKARAAGA
jgi:hypothetical protein